MTKEQAIKIAKTHNMVDEVIDSYNYFKETMENLSESKAWLYALNDWDLL